MIAAKLKRMDGSTPTGVVSTYHFDIMTPHTGWLTKNATADFSVNRIEYY